MATETTPLPGLGAVRVADDRDVEPLLSRAAADLSALTVRFGVASHRAETAEGRAGRSLAEEEVDLRRRLAGEQAEQRRRLDDELARTRADAAAVVAAAHADALAIVRAASVELDVAVATFGGAPVDAPVEVEAPVQVEPRVEVEADSEVAEPVDEVEEPLDDLAAFAPPAEFEQAPPTLLSRLVQLDAVRLVAVVIVLVVLLTWVR